MHDTRTRYLFLGFTILIVVSIIATFYRYMILRDYVAIDDTGPNEVEIIE